MMRSLLAENDPGRVSLRWLTRIIESAVVVAVCMLVVGSVHGAETDAYKKFQEWGLSFEYPSTWGDYPADQVSQIKKSLADALREDKLELTNFAMRAARNNAVMIMVLKYTSAKPKTAAEILAERKRVHDAAMQARDVTKVNLLTVTEASQLPAVEEDVERSNGGRGRTLKVIAGNAIYEISMIVRDGKSFTTYSGTFERIKSSLVVVR